MSHIVVVYAGTIHQWLSVLVDLVFIFSLGCVARAALAHKKKTDAVTRSLGKDK